MKLIKVSDVILDPQSVKKELIKTKGIENHQHSDFVGRKERGEGCVKSRFIQDPIKHL